METTQGICYGAAPLASLYPKRNLKTIFKLQKRLQISFYFEMDGINHNKMEQYGLMVVEKWVLTRLFGSMKQVQNFCAM
jgi:hypothetical protein